MRKPAPEFLLIDVGNTRLKWATASPGGSIRVVDEIATKTATPAWIVSLARKYRAQKAVFSSVEPKLVASFRSSFAGRIEIVRGDMPNLGLQFDYPQPAEIGADRIAAAIAVQAGGAYPAIIVACGTATAFTVLNAKGRLCGGAIAPGLQTQLAALIGATAQLPMTKLRQPKSALAKSTQDAIRAGVLLNFQGGVKEIIGQLSKELPGSRRARLIVTGGHAPFLAKNLGLPFELRPLLVMEGLLMIGSRRYMPV